jgi:hypothetical protein
MQTGKGLLVQNIRIFVRKISQSSRKVDEILCFAERGASSVKEMQIILFTVARRTLHNIRRNGVGRAAQLAREAIHFFSGEGSRALVHRDGQIIGELPRSYLRIISHALFVLLSCCLGVWSSRVVTYAITAIFIVACFLGRGIGFPLQFVLDASTSYFRGRCSSAFQQSQMAFRGSLRNLGCLFGTW